MRPAAHPPSFASPKEGGPRKGDPQSASPVRPVGRTGAACDARSWGGVAELAAFPLRVNSTQTAATSQITKCVCPSAHAPTPGPALLGAASRGGERLPHGCCFSSCAWGRVRAARCRPPGRSRPGEPSAAKDHRPSEAMARVEPAPTPLLTVPRSAGPGVSACRRTRASSSGSSKLFDRSCLAEAAQGVLRRHPRTEYRRLPPRHRRGGHGQRGRLFLAYLLLTKQKKVGAPPGAHPGLRPLQKQAVCIDPNTSTIPCNLS